MAHLSKLTTSCTLSAFLAFSYFAPVSAQQIVTAAQMTAAQRLEAEQMDFAATTETHSKEIFTSMFRGTGPNTRKTFVVAYISSIVSSREGYRKFPGENHCRWSYSDYRLRRTLSYEENGTKRVVGENLWTAATPFPSDSTKRSCGHIRDNSIIPAANLANTLPKWQNQVDADKPEVEKLISQPL